MVLFFVVVLLSVWWTFSLFVYVCVFVVSVCECVCDERVCAGACVHAWVCMRLCRFVSGGQNALFNVMCQNPCHYD